MNTNPRDASNELIEAPDDDRTTIGAYVAADGDLYLFVEPGPLVWRQACLSPGQVDALVGYWQSHRRPELRN